MWRNIALTTAALVFGFGVLFISVFKSAAVKYDFKLNAQEDGETSVLGEDDVFINYNLAYHGKVLPDHPLWPVKALRDKLWLLVTTSPTRKAELRLLFADKRIASSVVLFEREKYNIGISTLTKAEKYLEEAADLEKKNRKNGIDTTDFLIRLAWASLKHYEVMQEDLLPKAPEDARPTIIQTQGYSIRVYESVRDALFEKGVKPPENPFNWN